ncbi:formylmethanofuran dehydrogenase subunit C [Aeoliella sp. SH292]|uniref:formylmethanofuran dehydrogenase subunit C n=1 Tax=Aeoliella sp. SH292 TaxID=3454464 RepID=UPI003F9BE2D0
MPLTIRPRSLDTIPVSLAGVTPDALVEKSLVEIEKTLVWHGNRQVPLAELFQVSGTVGDLVLQLEGDFSYVHHIGAGISQGEIRVEGNVGRHAGQGMRGGSLVIEGSAGDWLGSEMRGGRIEVQGDAANHVGGSLAASKVGMRGGQITVHGSVGTHAGERMRRGSIVVLGDCGEWPGYQMRAGTIVICGECGPHPAAGMRRGTLILLGETPTLLPTFRYACDYSPQALGLVFKELELDREVPGSVELYNGDLLEGGRGEVLIAKR